MSRRNGDIDGAPGGISFALRDQVVLFDFIRLSSFSGFAIASCMTILICVLERGITFLITSRYYPRKWEMHAPRINLAAWRAAMYAVATFLRLMYMLIAMTLNAGLIILMIGTLSCCQFLAEYKEVPELFPGASPIRVKTSIYSPLPVHHHSNQVPPRAYDDDVEMAPTPESSFSGSWMGGVGVAREKARHIMSGGGSSTRLFGSSSRLGSSSRIHGSSSRLQSGVPVGRGAPLSPIRGGSSGVASPGGSNGNGRRILFQIGGDDERSESD